MAKTETNLRDQGDLSVANDNNRSTVANDNNRPFPAYLLDRSARRREPGHLFEFNQMRAALAAIGGTGVYVPDALKPYHITCNEFYYGAATPKAIEKPHWHFQGWEVYLVLEGEAEMLVKWHEEVDGSAGCCGPTIRLSYPRAAVIGSVGRPTTGTWWSSRLRRYRALGNHQTASKCARTTATSTRTAVSCLMATTPISVR